MDDNSSFVRKLALGTVQFGLKYGISNSFGITNSEEVSQILQLAWENGINTIDTARNYGESEMVLGNQSKFPFKIVTKFSGEATTADKLNKSLNDSLEALKVKRVYGLLSHDVESLLENRALWDALMLLKEKKFVEKIGYSLYKPEQLIALFNFKMIPDIIQVPFNFIDQRFEPFFQDLKSKGCEIHVRSIFLQGLFFIKSDDLPEYFSPVKPLLATLQSKLKDVNDLAAWLMQFVLKEKNIDKVIFWREHCSAIKRQSLEVVK